MAEAQVTIPAEIREDMGLTPGTDVVFMEVDDMVILKKSEELLSVFKVYEERAKELKLTKKDLKEEVSNYKGIDIVNIILPEDVDLDP